MIEPDTKNLVFRNQEKKLRGTHGMTFFTKMNGVTFLVLKKCIKTKKKKSDTKEDDGWHENWWKNMTGWQR